MTMTMTKWMLAALALLLMLATTGFSGTAPVADAAPAQALTADFPEGVGSATAKSLFVNPVSGSDTNPGTQAAPFKTLGKALSKAIAGDTVKLAAGRLRPGL